MKISAVLSNQYSFGEYYVTGKDRDNYAQILKPYKDKINKMTKNFTVIIKDEYGPLGVTDSGNEAHYLYNLPTVTIIPNFNAHKVLPQAKLYVYPEAEYSYIPSKQAHQMINVIKKGLKLYG